MTTTLVAETRERHHLTPTGTVAVGRLITAAALLGPSLKGQERISLQIRSDGPIGGIVADVMTLPDYTVGARAYTRNADADVPLTGDGRFDVPALIGKGKLQVVKSYEIGQPYAGIVDLVSGEIASDLAAYFGYSQQIPSVIALGVHLDSNGVRTAGGVIAQVLPGADDDAIAKLEANIAAMDPITTQLLNGVEPEGLVDAVCAGMQARRLRDYDVIFACRCTREKVETALLGLGKAELLKMAHDEPETETICDFCKRSWVLTSDEVTALAGRIA